MRSKKVLKNILSSVILQIATIICGLIVPRLIITSFGSNVNGLINSITQFLAYITLLESGFGPVVKSILYKPIANKEKQQIETILKATEKFFRTIAIIFIFYILILCFIYPTFIGNEFDRLFTISLIVIIAISTLAEYFFGMTYRLYLQAEQKTYVISIIQMVTLIANTIIMVILIKLGFNIVVVKIIGSLIYICRPIMQNLYVKKKYKLNLKNGNDNYEIKQKWDGLAQHIASVVHGNTDITILTIFSETREISVYSVYLLIITGVKNLVQAFTVGLEDSFGNMIARGEKKQLNESFKIYEQFYFTIVTIFFTSAMELIIPFVKVYTLGITDVNYIRPIFAYIFVIAEFVGAIRQPYNQLVKATGHFKQTRRGAWVEAISNIIISIILVTKLGIIGVAIGTLVAMAIRTIELIMYTSKNILERSIMYSVKRIILIAVQVILVVMTNRAIPMLDVNSYLMWIIDAIIVVIISVIVIISSNLIIYKKQTKGLRNILKNIVKDKKK